MSSQQLTRGNTYARQPGSVDVNVQFDFDEMARRNHSHFRKSPYQTEYRMGKDVQSQNVLEGEVLVTDQRKSGKFRDKRLHCFSSANGIRKKSGGNLMDELAFAGVAVTPVDVHSSNRDQGFVSAFAGLNKIFNTGSGVIHAGDIVYLSKPGWDVKRYGTQGQAHSIARTTASNKGLPRDKIRFGVDSMAQGADSVATQVKDFVADASTLPGADDEARNCCAARLALEIGKLRSAGDDAAAAKHAHAIAKIALDHHRSMQRRVIGRALSHAKPGQAFDIVLRGG